MTSPTMPSAEQNDADLVLRSLAGDRDAFGRIVSKYQTLVCSLAYSRIGHLGQSEDVAQETFITAWKHLRLLRDPARLRSWLCGIVRNRTHKCLRREGREPVHAAESLEVVQNSPAQEALPSEHAVSREEQAILWRSLERIPEIYRVPLVLFYREHESIEAVAIELGLSEDAVKQRLSRGRRLLQEEVQAFVENTLRRTAPGETFSATVLAALTADRATVAGVGAAGKGAVAKAGLLSSWLAPLLGIVGGITAHWLVVRIAPNARERRLKKATFTALWLFVLAWCIPGLVGMRALSRFLQWDQATYVRTMAGYWSFYALVLAALGVVMFRRVAAARRTDEAALAIPQATGYRLTPGAGIALALGVHVAYFCWLIDLAWRAQDRLPAAAMAGLMMVLTAWNILGMRGKSGSAATRALVTHHAVVWGLILVILNFRLELWLASLNGLSLEAMHRLLPAWMIPLLTLMLLGWVFLLLKLTSRLLQLDRGLPT